MRINKDIDIDKFIKDKIFIKRKSSGNIRLNNNYKYFLNGGILEYIDSCFDDSMSLKESLYRIYYDINEHPKCIFCGNLSQFDIYQKTLFRSYCSNMKCVAKINNINGKKTKLERYGDAKYNNREKCKNTKLERYGDASYNNSSKMKQTKIEKYGEYFINTKRAKQTKLERYGNPNYNNKEKSRQTCLDRYNAISCLSKESNIREDIKQANIKKYGEYFVNVKKAKQTKLDRYGDTNYNNTKKIQQTCLERYGYNTVLKDPRISQKIANSEIRKLREYITKKKNKTFNTSIPETESYKLLKEKYPDVVRQYKSDRYPFVCDFYIPSLDLYIECNYHWTHGGKPYEGTEDDLDKVQQWKDKNTKYYDNAIETWTIRDVNKRNVAKENSLNYIELWNITELKTWINNE